MERVHFIHPYFLNPLHPIGVTLVGAGGSGSQMLSALARINSALTALGRTGLNINVYDPDTVEETNVGRQMFSPSEIGMNKAVALVSRFNRFYGTDWNARPKLYSSKDYDNANIIVSCVDNLNARKEVAASFERSQKERRADEYRAFYWLDLGNAQRTGQAILGSAKIEQPKIRGIEAVAQLPTFDKEFDMKSINEEDSGPSCSMAEALRKQDLFINSTLAQLSGSLLWNLLVNGQTSARGFYLNLDTLTSVPIEL